MASKCVFVPGVRGGERTGGSSCCFCSLKEEEEEEEEEELGRGGLVGNMSNGLLDLRGLEAWLSFKDEKASKEASKEGSEEGAGRGRAEGGGGRREAYEGGGGLSLACFAWMVGGISLFELNAFVLKEDEIGCCCCCGCSTP